MCSARDARSKVHDTTAIFVEVSTECPAHPDASASALSPCTLGEINHFKDVVDATIGGGKCSTIILCTGTDGRVITTCAYLIGSYMLLCLGSSLADVASAFQPIADRFERLRIGEQPEAAVELTIFDCWEALYCGKMQGWLDFTSATPDLDRCIDMEEYVH
jgi:hypothetical protein